MMPTVFRNSFYSQLLSISQKAVARVVELVFRCVSLSALDRVRTSVVGTTDKCYSFSSLELELIFNSRKS